MQLRLARQHPRARERASSARWRSSRRRRSCPRACRPAIRGDVAARRRRPTRTALPESGFDLEAHVKEIERGYIAEALKRAGGVQVKAAELLGMSFRSFRYYVKKYNLR